MGKIISSLYPDATIGKYIHPKDLDLDISSL